MSDSDSQEETTYTKKQLESMTVVKIKVLLQAKGISTSGVKAELIQKVLDYQNPLESEIAQINSLRSISKSEYDLLYGDSKHKEEQTTLSTGSLSEANLLGAEGITSLEKESENNISEQSIKEDILPEVSKPLKKRVLIQTQSKLHATKTENVATPQDIEVDMRKGQDLKQTQPLSTISDKEKREIRAKRFNLAASDKSLNHSVLKQPEKNVQQGKSLESDEEKRIKRAQRFGNAQITPDESIDKMKKRTDRFGISVSTVLKKVEDEEKLLKRKIKFESTSDEKAKLKRRAERFGL